MQAMWLNDRVFQKYDLPTDQSSIMETEDGTNDRNNNRDVCRRIPPD